MNHRIFWYYSLLLIVLYYIDIWEGKQSVYFVHHDFYNVHTHIPPINAGACWKIIMLLFIKEGNEVKKKSKTIGNNITYTKA